MTEAEALQEARSVVRENGLERQVFGLQSIRLVLGSEVREDPIVREALGLAEAVDAWHVRFKARAEEREGGTHQYLSDILVAISDTTGEASVHRHLAKEVEQRSLPGVCPKCNAPVTTEPGFVGGWSGLKKNGMVAGGPLLANDCMKCGSSLRAYQDVYGEEGRVGGNYALDPTQFCWHLVEHRPRD